MAFVGLLILLTPGIVYSAQRTVAAVEEPGSISEMVSPSRSSVVANLQFCVPETTPPGTYPVHFELQTEVSGSGYFGTFFLSITKMTSNVFNRGVTFIPYWPPVR